MPAYFLSRLPASDENGTDAPIRDIISRSFAAYRARQRGDADWVESRIASAFAARKRAEPEDDAKWLDRVSGLTGVSVDILHELSKLYEDTKTGETTEAAICALLEWLDANPDRFLELVRPENIQGLFGGEYDKLTSERDKGAYALPVISAMLRLWMNGSPLNEMESCHPKEDKAKCKHARHFVLRIVPDLAFVAGLPARLLVAQDEDDEAIPLVIATLGSCVREGCDSPENLATRLAIGRSVSRVAARMKYEELQPYFQDREPNEPFEDTMNRYHKASALSQFSEP